MFIYVASFGTISSQALSYGESFQMPPSCFWLERTKDPCSYTGVPPVTNKLLTPQLQFGTGTSEKGKGHQQSLSSSWTASCILLYSLGGMLTVSRESQCGNTVPIKCLRFLPKNEVNHLICESKRPRLSYKAWHSKWTRSRLNRHTAFSSRHNEEKPRRHSPLQR